MLQAVSEGMFSAPRVAGGYYGHVQRAMCCRMLVRQVMHECGGVCVAGGPAVACCCIDSPVCSDTGTVPSW